MASKPAAENVFAATITEEIFQGPTDFLQLSAGDGLQLNAKETVATPVNWKPGQDVIIPAAVSDEDAKKKYPQGFKTIKPYLRTVKL